MARRRTKSITPLRGAIASIAQGFLLNGSAIGIDGGLPWHYSEDLKRFKRRTMGCAVIMGRVTWDSIDRKALPGRRNIVISRSAVSGVEHYDSIEKAIGACGNEDLWVIGGAQIYEAAMAYLNVLDITLVPDIINRDDAVKPPKIDLSGWCAVWRRYALGDTNLTTTIYHRIDSD